MERSDGIHILDLRDYNHRQKRSTELFHTTNLAPMEIIVYTLKQAWNKSYTTISKMLNRDQRTIETTFKRAVAKIELVKDK